MKGYLFFIIYTYTMKISWKAEGEGESLRRCHPVIERESGHYFLRRVQFGSPPQQNHISSMQSEGLPYPLSTVGIVTYRSEDKIYRSCGCLLEQNLLITFTPIFEESFSFNLHEQQVREYLKEKHINKEKPWNQQISEEQYNQQLTAKKIRRAGMQLSNYLDMGRGNQIHFESCQTKKRYAVTKIIYPNVKQTLPDNFLPELPLCSSELAFLKIEEEEGEQLSKECGYLGIHFDESQVLEDPQAWVLGLDENNEAKLIESEVQMNQQIGTPVLWKIQQRYCIFALFSSNNYATVLNPAAFDNIQKKILKTCEKISLNDIPIASRSRQLLQEIFMTQRPLLTFLDLSNSSLTQIWDIKHLFKSASWRNLRHLILDKNPLGCGVIKCIVKKQPQLLVLSLRQTQLNDAHVQLLTKGEWPSLRSLNLKMNHLTNLSMSYLIKNNWYFLNGINMQNNRLDSSSLPSLLTMENKSIIGLILANNQIAIRMIETVMINEKFNREIKLD